MSITQVTFKTWICEELIFIQTLFLQCFPGIFQKPVNAYLNFCTKWCKTVRAEKRGLNAKKPRARRLAKDGHCFNLVILAAWRDYFREFYPEERKEHSAA